MTAIYKASAGLPIYGRIGAALAGGVAGGFIYSGFSNHNRYKTILELEDAKNRTLLNLENVKNAGSGKGSSSVANSSVPLDELLGDSSPLHDILYSIHIVSFIGFMLFLYLVFILTCRLYITPDIILSFPGGETPRGGSKININNNNNKLMKYIYKIVLNYNKVSNYFILYLLITILIILIYIAIMSYNIYIDLDNYIYIINKYYKK